MKYVIMCSVPVNDRFFDHEIEEYSGTRHDSELDAAEELFIALHDGNVNGAWVKEVEECQI